MDLPFRRVKRAASETRPARDDGHGASSLHPNRVHPLSRSDDPFRLQRILVLGSAHQRRTRGRLASDHEGHPGGLGSARSRDGATFVSPPWLWFAFRPNRPSDAFVTTPAFRDDVALLGFLAARRGGGRAEPPGVRGPEGACPA